ncbi:MAG: tetratricopeptide repeat protein, partial [Bacteroidota bacterium]
MQRFVLGQKLAYLWVLWLLGATFSYTFAQNDQGPISDAFYQNKLDSLNQIHDLPEFRSKAGQTFRTFKSNWQDDQVEQGYAKVLDLAIKQFGPEHRMTALVQHQFGIFYYLEGKEDKALALFEKSIQLRQSLLPEGHSELGHSYYLLGRTHYNLDNNEAAIDAFKKSYQIYEALQNCSMLVNALRMLGDTYSYLEEQALAEAYFDLTLANAKMCYDLDNPALANLYLYAANVFSDNPTAQDKALNYYLASQEIFERGNNETRTNYASALISQGAIYIDTEQYQSAEKVLNQALNLKKQLENDYEVDAIFEYLGALSRRRKDYKKALDYYQSVYEIRSSENDAVSEEMNYVYHNIAETYKESGAFSKAADYYQKALIAADRNFTSTDFNENPNVDALD